MSWNTRSPEHPFVLVVDDDALQRREIARCLSDLGIETCEEENGKDAVETIQRHRPAVVIMDIRMPVLDGVEAVKALGKHPGYDPKIILITGDPDSLYRANRMGLKVFGVVEKPIPLRVLSRFVTNALGSLSVPLH